MRPFDPFSLNMRAKVKNLSSLSGRFQEVDQTGIYRQTGR